MLDLDKTCLNRTYLKILDMRKSHEKGDTFAHMPASALLHVAYTECFPKSDDGKCAG